EPSSISFPLRKAFQKNKNVFIRVTEVNKVDVENKSLKTDLGPIQYDYLVLAMGADTNFFGNEELAKKTYALKSVSEAIALRNALFDDYEKALTETDFKTRQGFIDIVIVGGGATGVEIAGALAEMKKYIVPKDYGELDHKEIDIYLMQGADRLLKGMSDKASEDAKAFLEKMGVHVKLNSRVVDFDGEKVIMKDGSEIASRKVIWAAGIKANTLKGIHKDLITWGNRVEVDQLNQIKGADSVFAIGDMCLMKTEKYPEGHPQVAQVAIQQAKQLAKNIIALEKGKATREFEYKDPGSMATIGRNKAVCDLPGFKFSGWFAWVLWLAVHLFALIGTKNKVFVFLNWMWNYVTYDQSLRLIIKPKK
ncbi:MAG: NAD(P)/FAD-dependent oxidoreductase, partial [Bacteroidota bacterium]